MRRIAIATLIFPNFQLLDLAGPWDAFGEIKVLSQGEVEYQLTAIGTTRGQIRSSSGLTVTPDQTIFDDCPPFDTLIVAGGLGIFDIFENPTLSAWLSRQAQSCRRIAAICNGVFGLAAAGLIDGKTVSTHWMDATHLARRFPKAKVEHDKIYVKDDKLYTTAGVSAGIDLTLALIEEDLGRKFALGVAKYLVVHLRRSGGQSQFSQLLEIQSHTDSKVNTVQNFLLTNLDKPHTLQSIACKAAVSPRQLSRLFLKNCGTGPMTFLEDARVDAVRCLLETTQLTTKEVSVRCGFDSPEQMRRVFVRRLEISPVEYRRRFRLEIEP
ncbi:transcriptional regulator GlxA family with amidase domain [Bradyrhizobium elkanii]|uniref:GlxA family transcriptional regulator n=1 Tax=Bradyrhizobium TaxID=374 RepID=UPI0027120461|nr:GlxA family transcriptional regulator [Bradyrhizobium elkanii]WLA38865.1 GlxA family transcriptional regulator [Bradyrhizobium elkanii]